MKAAFLLTLFLCIHYSSKTHRQHYVMLYGPQGPYAGWEARPLCMRPVFYRRKTGRYQSRGRGAGWTVALVVVAAVLGSSQTAPEPRSAQSLRERVTAFWEARIKGDEVSAYQYEIYAYTGELTVTQYVQARSPTLKYMAYTIDTIQEQEQEAQVTINAQCRMDIPGMVDLPLPLPVKEQWVRLDDGQWYRNTKPKKPGKTADQKG